LSALTAIRHELRRGNRGSFTVPVYDGARRFDVIARVLPPSKSNERALHLRLTLSPIAGFKGETSDDGDPENAPRPVEVAISDDADHAARRHITSLGDRYEAVRHYPSPALRVRVPSTARRVRVSDGRKTLTRPRLTPRPPSPAVRERGKACLARNTESVQREAE